MSEDPFAELKQRAAVKVDTKQAEQAANYSEFIREGRPGFKR